MVENKKKQMQNEILIGDFKCGMDEQGEETKKRRKKYILIICFTLTILAILGSMIVMRINYFAKESKLENDIEALSYQESFHEAPMIAATLVEAQIKLNEGKITNEQFDEYFEIYSDFADSILRKYEIPEEELKKYNESVQNIFGSNTMYLLKVEKQRNIVGFHDGLMCSAIGIKVDIAWINGKISDEKYSEYQEKSNELIKNPSNEGTYDFMIYVSDLLGIEIYTDETNQEMYIYM